MYSNFLENYRLFKLHWIKGLIIKMSQQVGSQQDTIGGQGQNEEVEEGDEEEAEQKVVQRVNTSNRIQPLDIIKEPLDIMAQRMREQPDESLEELKVNTSLFHISKLILVSMVVICISIRLL